MLTEDAAAAAAAAAALPLRRRDVQSVLMSMTEATFAVENIAKFAVEMTDNLQ
jgi:hypothetical protein